MNILITGITGFLGSSLALEFLKRSYNVIGLKRKNSSLLRIKEIESQILIYDTEKISYEKLFNDNQQIDVLIHTATCYGRKNETPIEIYNANTKFPLEVLDIASKSNVKVFINTDTVLDKFLNIYSLSKNHFLEWGKFYSANHKIKFVNLRLEHFYGFNDDDYKFTSFLINSCKRNVKKIDLTLGEQKRDFIYISDVVEAYILIVNNILNKNVWFETYDIGSGNAISIKDFAIKVHSLLNSKSILNFGALPYRKNEIMKSKANVQRLKEMGWLCKVNLEEGLKRTIK